MQVTTEIKTRVVEKLKEGIALAEAKYNQKFAFPRVTYDLSGGVAGRANYTTWHIDLNAGLLMRNIEDFIARTVPHELAHLITDRVYPEAHAFRGYVATATSYKRVKREVHGPKWRSVCEVLGMTDVTRCHSYDTSEVKRHRGRYDWQCTGCQKVIQLGPKHNMRQQTYGDVFHKGCGRARLVRVDTAVVDKSPTALPPARPVMHLLPVQTSQPKPATPAPKTYGSKLEHCKAIYAANRNLSRAQLINLFIVEAGCTKAGASTYHYTCSK